MAEDRARAEGRELEVAAWTGALPPSRRELGFPLLEYVVNGTLSIPRGHRELKRFVRRLRRAASSPRFTDGVRELRDAVIRSTLKDRDRKRGLSVALSGVRGGEGTSHLALLLALSLGEYGNYRVCFLDGGFNLQRFWVLAGLLKLSRNSCKLCRGSSMLLGYFNEAHPNVYFLQNAAETRSLEFFSDKQLKEVLDELCHGFDFVVIDLPPLLADSSNIFVGSQVDRFYLLAEAARTRLGDLDRSLEMAAEAGIEIAGVVVNQQKAPFWSRFFWRDYFF